MDNDTFTASDFSSAEASLSSESAAASPAPAESSAPVTETAPLDAATTLPADSATTTSPSTEPAAVAGPIPFQAHKTALENARTKATQEANAQWQQYEWAKQIDPQDFQQVQQISRHFKPGGNPIEGLQSLMAEIRKDPQYDAQLKSMAARALSQRSTAQPQVQDFNPKSIQLEDGSIFSGYSADQVQALVTQELAKVRQELQPVLKTHEAMQTERAEAARTHQIEQFTSSAYADIVTWPGMELKENQQALAQEIARMQVDPNDSSAVLLAANTAFRKVIASKGYTASRQAVLNDINRQAAASTVNPAQSSTRAPKTMDEMSISEALQYVAAQSR